MSVDAGTNVTTVTGNSLSIRCNATGFPVPQITWSKDGTSLSAKGPVYVLSTLKPSDSGRYQCIATNVDGVDTQDIRIHVLGKYLILAQEKKLDEKFTLHICAVQLFLFGIVSRVGRT